MGAALQPLAISPGQRRFDALIGVGGIGTGVFFALDGDHTLGREESRGGHFLPGRDYCKLHIIAHYIHVLLGSGFQTFPIGRIGDDKDGRLLFDEICQTGFDTRFLELVPGGTTLFSFCLKYPDGSGGNLTTDNSVNATVDAALVNRAQPTLASFAHRGIALAAPEVSLEARLRLIELGRAHGFFCAAALTSTEVQTDTAKSILAQANLAAFNLDEAAAFVGAALEEHEPLSIVHLATARLNSLYPHLWVSITAGKYGAWTWDGQSLFHRPAIETEAVSTAGAGDAFLAGLLVGITAGLTLEQAQELAGLLASLSVTSPHTIHPGIDRQLLRDFAEHHAVRLSLLVSELLSS